ncbi:VTC domain-containing protein [Candidatus Leptofilum sp.]|uniref:VTC domain-containing protein n=1 Tax=Candidatus Leptofilum sp. TaxID=3241576 RepID=UPI003B5CD68D
MDPLRYELKLVAPVVALPSLCVLLRSHPECFRQHYPPRQVNSIYFDTSDLQSYQANLIGNAWRNKLRLRWYGVANGRTLARLELKHKNNMLGYKSVVRLTEPIELTQTWDKLQRHLRRLTPQAWHIPLREATQPTLLTKYFREYFISADGVIRVTLDYKLKAYDQRLSRSPNLRYALPATNQMVVEIKAPAAAAERLEEAVTYLPFKRVRHSKYVNGLRAFLS